MDICIPKILPVTGAEKLSWMTDISFKQSSFRCCRELRLRKRHRESDECNLFSRIQKWVGDDLVCCISPQLSPSSQVQLSPKDSGIDLNSPSRRDDGNLSSNIMPDSRSEDCERIVSLPKRRRSSSSDDLLKKDRKDLVKGTRESSEGTMQPDSKSAKLLEKMGTVSEMVTKKYTLVSNITKKGPLVIKLRACPVESTQTAIDELKDKELEPQLDYIESPGVISSTDISVLSDETTLCHSRSRHLSPLHQSRSFSTVVSSTTRNRKEFKKKKTSRRGDCVELTVGVLAGGCNDKADTAAVDSGTCLDDELSTKMHAVGNNFSDKRTGFVDHDHRGHTWTSSPSAKRVGVASKKYGRTRSSRETNVNDVNTSGNTSQVIVGQETSLPVVTSSCAVTENEEFISEKRSLGFSHSLISNADESSKGKKTTGFLSEFTKFIKSSNQSVNASVSFRQGHGNYQVTRRHARIFRRSTLVPQLHWSVLLRSSLSRMQDMPSSLGISVKEESVQHVEATSNALPSSSASNCVGIKDGNISVDTLGQLESRIVSDDVLSDILSTDLLFENEGDNEDIPDLRSTGSLCKAEAESEIIPHLPSVTSFCKARAGSEIIPDELLFNLPSTSSLCDAKDNSVLEETLGNLPNTSLLCESSFISDQMQLAKLRHRVFWLLKTLVPQLQLPNRFDESGPAVDEMIEVVCEELDSSRKKSTNIEVHASEFEGACLNSLVDLCRSPRDCLARLRCKVLAMLSMLLGLELDQFNDEHLLESLLDAVVCANRPDALPNDVLSSLEGTPELFRMAESDSERTFVPWEGETPEEVSSVDSFSDIPELLVESEGKFVTSDLEDFLEPPKLTAVNER